MPDRSAPSIDHIAIACRDVEALGAWYREVLGFEVAARKAPSRPDAPETTYLVGPPGEAARFEITPDDRRAPPAREPFTRGLSHIALRVDDFVAWERRISAGGGRWLGPAGEAVGGGKVRSFLDPEGNMLQIVQREAGRF
jgi:glyoxylase I family protein